MHQEGAFGGRHSIRHLLVPRKDPGTGVAGLARVVQMLCGVNL